MEEHNSTPEASFINEVKPNHQEKENESIPMKSESSSLEQEDVVEVKYQISEKETAGISQEQTQSLDSFHNSEKLFQNGAELIQNLQLFHLDIRVPQSVSEESENKEEKIDEEDFKEEIESFIKEKILRRRIKERMEEKNAKDYGRAFDDYTDYILCNYEKFDTEEKYKKQLDTNPIFIEKVKTLVFCTADLQEQKYKVINKKTSEIAYRSMNDYLSLKKIVNFEIFIEQKKRFVKEYYEKRS